MAFVHPFRAFATHCLGIKVHESAHSSGPVNRRGWSSNNLDVIRCIERSLIITTVLNAPEPAKIIVRNVPAQEDASGNAEVSAGVRARHDCDQVVYGPGGVQIQQFRIRAGDRARSLFDLLRKTKGCS